MYICIAILLPPMMSYQLNRLALSIITFLICANCPAQPSKPIDSSLQVPDMVEVIPHADTGASANVLIDTAASLTDSLSHNIVISTDYWSQDRVNPYPRKVVNPPFRLLFEQDTYTPPISKDMVITSRFGKRWSGPHRGIDIDLVSGDSVLAMLPGKVRFVGYSRGHGRTIVVRHAHDIETVYAHLSEYSVAVNDEVKEGVLIGRGGRTGNARGSHLHLEVRYKGVCVHPEYVFNFEKGNKIRANEIWVTNGWKNPINHSSYKKSDIDVLTNREKAIAHQANEAIYHRVQRGDTLGHIAILYDIPLKELCSINRIKPTSILRIGKRLQVR